MKSIGRKCRDFLEWPKEHQQWGQSEGNWHNFNLSGERLSNNNIATSLRKCYKDDGTGLFWEGTGRIEEGQWLHIPRWEVGC